MVKKESAAVEPESFLFEASYGFRKPHDEIDYDYDENCFPNYRYLKGMDKETKQTLFKQELQR